MTVLALALVTGAAPAEESAAPPSEDEQELAEARRLTRQGLEAYEAARYPEAIAAFEAAYASAPLPLLLYNLGQAHRLNGDCASAVRYYERFAETGPNGSVAEFVDSRLRELRPCARAEPLSRVEAAQRDTTPRTPAVARAPTQAELARRAEMRAPTVGGSQVTLKPLSSEPSGETSRGSNRSYLWPAILTGGAVVLLGTGSYFAWQSHEASDAVSQRFERAGEAWDASGAAIERRGKLYENVSIAALAASTLMGGATVWIWPFD